MILYNSFLETVHSICFSFTPKMNFNSHKEFMEYALEDDLVIDVSTCIPDGGIENEGASYVFDDGTPVKECGGLGYNSENRKKERLMRESLLQVKRRRMLQFESEAFELPFYNEEMPQTFFGSQETDNSLDMAISEMPQWVSSFTDPDSTSASCSEVLDLSSEEWVAECFNDQEMHLNVETGDNPPETPDGQVTTEHGNNLFSEAKEVPDQPLPTRQNVVFKGRKAYMRAPSKLPSSVAYPFDFIKPCGIHGDVTLKDINQKIRTPQPKPKPKQRDDDQSIPYPKSALTGKPVVGKTKIRTEGGTGSITIMRTKG